ncbi:MAG: hypothetical protein EAY66_05100, partial [Sphingobacteriales bacterium]
IDNMIEKPKWVNIENINKLSYVSAITSGRPRGDREKDFAHKYSQILSFTTPQSKRKISHCCISPSGRPSGERILLTDFTNTHRFYHLPLHPNLNAKFHIVASPLRGDREGKRILLTDFTNTHRFYHLLLHPQKV